MMVIQHNGSRRGFQQSPVSLVRLAQFHFRDPALARDKPGGPDGQKDRCRHSTADVEIVQRDRSEEHTSELQSRQYLVCRLLLEKKNAVTHLRRATDWQP